MTTTPSADHLTHRKIPPLDGSVISLASPSGRDEETIAKVIEIMKRLKAVAWNACNPSTESQRTLKDLISLPSQFVINCKCWTRIVEFEAQLLQFRNETTFNPTLSQTASDLLHELSLEFGLPSPTPIGGRRSTATNSSPENFLGETSFSKQAFHYSRDEMGGTPALMGTPFFKE